jgi:hypothetical protein
LFFEIGVVGFELSFLHKPQLCLQRRGIMQFTVNAHIRLMGYFRLQKDNTFRKNSPGRRTVLKADQVFLSLKEVYDRIEGLGASVEIENQKIPTGDENGRSLGDLIADLAPCVHRTHKSPIPSRDQLVEVIRLTDDSHNNFLSLDLEGRFAVIRHDEASWSRPTWAVRHETFGAGNNYAGPGAADDAEYMDELYRDMLAGWLEHLETGAMECYLDIPADATTEQLISKIKRWGQKKKAIVANANS